MSFLKHSGRRYWIASSSPANSLERRIRLISSGLGRRHTNDTYRCQCRRPLQSKAGIDSQAPPDAAIGPLPFSLLALSPHNRVLRQQLGLRANAGTWPRAGSAFQAGQFFLMMRKVGTGDAGANLGCLRQFQVARENLFSHEIVLFEELLHFFILYVLKIDTLKFSEQAPHILEQLLQSRLP